MAELGAILYDNSSNSVFVVGRYRGVIQFGTTSTPNATAEGIFVAKGSFSTYSWVKTFLLPAIVTSVLRTFSYVVTNIEYRRWL